MDILANYQHFFNLAELVGVLTSPSAWLVIGSLVLLEGLLSADNAIALAVVVKHLPKDQQKKALTYGIWGAYIFRAIAIGLGTLLVKLWWVKLLGGAYLLHMAYAHFKGQVEEQEDAEALAKKAAMKGFWGTIVMVELMDITFSVDSILAAFGVSSEIWVLYLGGMIGILVMREAAKVFLKLLEAYPEFEHTAYVLIFIIGAKLTLAAFDIHLPEALFFGTMGVVFFSTFFVDKVREQYHKIVGKPS